MDGHRETKETLEGTLSELAEVRGQIDSVKSECAEVVSKHKADEEAARSELGFVLFWAVLAI